MEGVMTETKNLNSEVKHKQVLKAKLSAKEAQREAMKQQIRPGNLTNKIA
jgi:hypothetical protein